MNAASATVLAVLAALVGLALWRNFRKGAPCSCGCSCSDRSCGCGSGCPGCRAEKES